SAGVSPLARRAVTNPAIWTGVASPLMIWPIAHAVRSALSSSPRNRAASRSGQVDPAPAVGALPDVGAGPVVVDPAIGASKGRARTRRRWRAGAAGPRRSGPW